MTRAGQRDVASLAAAYRSGETSPRDEVAVDYVLARRVQEALCGEVTAALKRVDALVSPSVPFVAPREDPEIRDGGDSEMLASGFADLTGHPSISIPAGSHAGLPVGLQLTGRPNGDADLLSVARAIEPATTTTT